jgi:hypothetical protein
MSFLAATLAALLPSLSTTSPAPQRAGHSATPPPRPQPSVVRRSTDPSEVDRGGGPSPLIGLSVHTAAASVRPRQLSAGDLWERLCVEVVSIGAVAAVVQDKAVHKDPVSRQHAVSLLCSLAAVRANRQVR